jgi:hypothetical protein
LEGDRHPFHHHEYLYPSLNREKQILPLHHANLVPEIGAG